MRRGLLVEDVLHIQLEPQPLAFRQRQFVREQQIRARQDRRAADVAAAVHERRVLILSDDLRADRRAAAAIEELADLRAHPELIGSIQLHDMGTIGWESTLHVEIAARIPEDLVDVPTGV